MDFLVWMQLDMKFQVSYSYNEVNIAESGEKFAHMRSDIPVLLINDQLVLKHFFNQQQFETAINGLVKNQITLTVATGKKAGFCFF